MDKTITTALFIAASMIMVLVLFNVAYPAVIEGADSVSRMAKSVADRMSYQVAIVHASAELDSDHQWQDGNSNSQFDVFAWIKNTGAARITALDRMDVFFGREGNYVRIPNESEAGASTIYWTWSIENDSEWLPTATLQIDIHNSVPLATGRYFMRVILPNGVSSEYFLGI